MKKPLLQAIEIPSRLAGLPQNTPVLLALSGGADSRVLLHLLSQMARTQGFPLYLAHLNHAIRATEADRDADFCRALAKRYALPMFCETRDVPALAKEWNMGIEEAARRARYDFFAELMERYEIPILVTAHHADDQLETVLFRLCRGSGGKGLCGIAPARRFGNGWLVRPMLQVSRREILAFCESEALDYVTDSTNADPAYTRNRLRTQVTPVLAEMFGEPEKKITEATASLAEDEAYLLELAEQLLGTAQTPKGLRKAVLANAPIPITNRALMAWVEQKTGYVPERVHVLALRALVTAAENTAEVALTGDFIAFSECGLLRISQRPQNQTDAYETPLQWGETVLGDGQIRVTVCPIDETTKVHKLSTQSYIILKLDSAIINNSLFWRTRREGDVLFSGGHHKKMRKLYGGSDISPRRRAVLPLLCDGEGIVWAPFVGARDGVDGKHGNCLISVELLCDTDQ